MAKKINSFQKKTDKKNVGALIGSIIILVIVIVSFVVSPFLSKLGDQQIDDIVLGTYGKEKITFSFLKDTPFKNELASITNNSSDSMDPRVAQVAYNRALSKAAAVDDFNSNGYIITKEQIDTAVINSGQYNVNGSFSPSVFKNTTEARKAEYRELISREMKVDSWIYHKLLQQRRSKASLEFISSLSDNKRNFRYVTFNFSDYPEELLKSYGADNSKLFTELHLSRITLSDKDTADLIIENITNGTGTFAELAAIYSSDNFSQNGGELSTSTYAYELESIFGISNIDDVLNLEVDGAPLLVENENGIVLLTVNQEITEPTFDNVDAVKEYMLTYERGTIEDYYYSLIEDNDTESLLNFGLDVKETGLFAINYGSDQAITTSIDRVSQDSIFATASSNDSFYETLFSLEDGVISEPIVLGDTISVFKLLEDKTDETITDSYYLSALDRQLLNYKSTALDNLIHSSDKYTDNFYQGYFEILSVNSGN